jgi:hypothetical protein
MPRAVIPSAICPNSEPARAERSNPLFSRTELIDLIEARPSVAVSVFLPTHKLGRETRQNPTALKNLLAVAKERLAQSGMDARNTEDLLAPARALLGDHDFWQHQDLGLALFLSDAGLAVHKLPEPMPERVVVGDAFHTLPLLALQDRDAGFLVLSATAEGVRTNLATRFGWADVSIPGMPASIEALDEPPDYEGAVQSHGYGRPHTGGQNMPKTQVFGDSPEEWRKGRLVEYARRAAAALAAYLARHPHEVVLIADTEIGGHIAGSDALAPHIAGFVETDPAALDDAGLYAAAWSVMQPRRDRDLDTALARLDGLTGRGEATACHDPAQLIAAAREGRVDTLFLARDATLPDTVDPQTGEAQVAAQPPAGGSVDLLDLAARLTLLSGGEVRLVSPQQLPGDAAMAAILRY